MPSSRVLITTLADRARASLFVVPTLFVIGGALLGAALLWIDEALGLDSAEACVRRMSADSAESTANPRAGPPGAAG